MDQPDIMLQHVRKKRGNCSCFRSYAEQLEVLKTPDQPYFDFLPNSLERESSIGAGLKILAFIFPLESPLCAAKKPRGAVNEGGNSPGLGNDIDQFFENFNIDVLNKRKEMLSSRDGT